MADRESNITLNILLNQASLNGTLEGLDALQIGIETVRQQEEQELAFKQQQEQVENAAMQRINAMVSAYNAEQQALAELAAVEQEFAASAQQSAEIMDEWNQQVQDAKLQPLTLGLEEVISLFDAEAQAAREAAQATQESTASMSAAGEAAGGEAEGEAAGGGSLYGIARGFRAGAGIGRIAGAGGATTTAFTGIADIIYLQQGFEKLGETFPAITEGIGGFIEKAGGLGTIIPEVGIALAAGAVAIQAIKLAQSEYNAELKVGEAQLKAALAAQQTYYTDVNKLTADQAKEQIATQTDSLNAQNSIIKENATQLKNQLLASFAVAAPTKGLISGMDLSTDQGLQSFIKEVSGNQALANDDKWKQLIIALTGANDKALELADSTTRLQQGLDAGKFAAIQAAEQARQEAADHITRQAQLDADDKATEKANQDKVQALYQSIDAEKGAIAIIQNSSVNLDKQSEQYQKNQEAITAYNKSIADQEAEITHINQISEPAAKAREALTAADQQYLKSLDDGQAQIKQAAEDAKLGSQANAEKAAVLRQERDATQEAIDSLKAHGIATDEDSKKYDALIAKLQDENTEIQSLQDAFHPAQVREATDAVNKAKDAFDKASQSIAEGLTNSVNAAQLKERNAELQYMPGSLQDTQARTDITTKYSRDVAKIEQDTADKITDIRTKLGQDELRITTDYNRQIFDDQIKYQDDYGKLVRDAQQTQAQDQIDYQTKISDINRQAQRNEYQDVADRNFSKLVQDQQKQADDNAKATQSYTQQEDKLRTHLANQEADLGLSLQRQEAQQQTAEERKIADAETAADNEIDQQNTAEKRKKDALNTSEQQQFDDLSRHEQDKISLLRQNYVQEFTLLQIEAQNKLNIATQTEQQIQANADAILNQGTNNFIDDLNRLNAMASGSSGGATAAGSGFSGQIINVPTEPTAPTSPTFDPVGAVNGVISTVVTGLQQGLPAALAGIFAP